MNGPTLHGSLPLLDPHNRTVQINVGGTWFQTTITTLRKAGNSSLLTTSLPDPSSSTDIVLSFDRDPDPFNILLRLLRTGKLHYDPAMVDKNTLIEEAHYYGLTPILMAAMASCPLDGIDVQRSGNLLPSGRDMPSVLSSAEDGSLWIGHGSKITAFDWALRKIKTTLTEFHTVDCLHRLSDSHAVAGAEDVPGLQVYDVMNGIHATTVLWSDKNDTRIYKPFVRAVCSSPAVLFAAFENGQRMENTVLLIDRETLQPTGEIGRQSGNFGHSKVATKLQWLPSYNLLMLVGIHGGAFGYSGYIRLWDLRDNKQTWEWKEPNNLGDPRVMARDSFCDATADEHHAGIFKVSVETGSIMMADLRNLVPRDPWITIEDTDPDLAIAGGGSDSKLLAYNKQLYCSRAGDVEVWSKVQSKWASTDLEYKEYGETYFRRNFLEHSRRHGGYDVTHMEAGGNRLFIARKEMQGVEVWETTRLTSNF